MRRETIVAELVVEGDHDDEGEATTGVTPPSSKRVGATDDVLVVEYGRPCLTRDEGRTKDT